MDHTAAYQHSLLISFRNPDEKDIQLKQDTETFISIIIASETQREGHNWYANARSEPSVAPDRIKTSRSPSWRTTGHSQTKRGFTNLEPYNLRSSQSRNPLPPQSSAMSASRAEIPSPDLPQAPDGASFNNQMDTSVCRTSIQLSQ